MKAEEKTSEAIEFNEWIYKNGYRQVANERFYCNPKMSIESGKIYQSAKELYDRFKQEPPTPSQETK